MTNTSNTKAADIHPFPINAAQKSTNTSDAPPPEAMERFYYSTKQAIEECEGLKNNFPPASSPDLHPILTNEAYTECGDSGMSANASDDIAILKENLRNREKQQDKLERTLDTISGSLASLREMQIKDTADMKLGMEKLNGEINTKIAALPTKWWLFSTLLGMLGVILGMIYFTSGSSNKQTAPQQPTIIMMPYAQGSDVALPNNAKHVPEQNNVKTKPKNLIKDAR